MTSKKSKKKIFRVFSVPTDDLEREDKKDGEIVALIIAFIFSFFLSVLSIRFLTFKEVEK